MEKETLRHNLTARDTWMRGLYILLFAVFYSLAELVLVAVVVFQFISQLVSGRVNARLLEFGQQLSQYLYDALRFFTFNSEVKPYPFSSWPEIEKPDPAPSSKAAATKKKSSTKKKAATKKKTGTKKRASSPSPSNASTDKGDDGGTS